MAPAHKHSHDEKSVKGAMKRGVKRALTSEPAKNALRKVARSIKGRVKGILETKCPKCKEVANFALSRPRVREAIEGAEQKLKKKCPTCSEVLDVVGKA